MWKPPEFTGGDLIGYVIRLYYYDRETLVVAVQGNITDPDIKWWFPERMPEEGPLYCQVGCNAEAVELFNEQYIEW